MNTAVHKNPLGWMLDDAIKMPETRHAILLSADGLLIAHSMGIGRDDADRHAAAMSALQSIARNTSEFCRNEPAQWRQSISEFDGGYALLVGAGPGAYVAVSATEKVNLEDLTFRLHELVQRLGKELTSPPRQGTGSPV